MKLIHIKSTITPKNYSVVREILKRQQGEKLAPYIYKLNKLGSLEKYLDKESINYEVYQSIETNQEEKLKKQLINGKNEILPDWPQIIPVKEKSEESEEVSFSLLMFSKTISELLKSIGTTNLLIQKWLEEISELVFEKFTWEPEIVSSPPYFKGKQTYVWNRIKFSFKDSEEVLFSLVVWKKQINPYLNFPNSMETSSSLQSLLKNYPIRENKKGNWGIGSWRFKPIKTNEDFQKLKNFFQEYKKQFSKDREISKQNY